MGDVARRAALALDPLGEVLELDGVLDGNRDGGNADGAHRS